MLSDKDKSKIKELLYDYLIDQHNLNPKENFRCLSPTHNDEKPSMGYSSKYNVCHCFACGKTYDIFSLVAQDYNLSNRNFKEVLNKIKELYPDYLDIKVSKPKYKESEELYDYSDYFKKCFSEKNKNNYLINRGISTDMIEKYHIGYDSFRKTAVFPINDNCYFSRGTLENDNRKYNSKGKLFCWGEEKLKDSTETSFLVITEGIIDAISLEQVSDFKTISLNGVANYPRLLRAIKEYDYKGNFILALDNDDAGKKFSDLLKEELTNSGISVVVPYSFVASYKDINEALLNDKEKLKNSCDYLATVLENYKNNYMKEKLERNSDKSEYDAGLS